MVRVLSDFFKKYITNFLSPYYIRIFSEEEEDLPRLHFEENLGYFNKVKVVTGEGYMLQSESFIKGCRRIANKEEGLVEVLFYQSGLHEKTINGNKEERKRKNITKTIQIDTSILKDLINSVYIKIHGSLNNDNKKLVNIIKETEELLRKEKLILYLAPSRPKYHFAILDEKQIYLQEPHGPDEPKKQIVIKNDPELIRKYIETFDNWIKREDCNNLIFEQKS